MKIRRKRAAPKAKSVQKKKAPAAAVAPPSPVPASPEDHNGIETLAAATETFAAAPEQFLAAARAPLYAAPPPPTASGALNANKKAFLNLVGQIAQESLRMDKTSDVGHQGVRSGHRFSSSSSSSSSGDDNSFRVHGCNRGMVVEQGIEWRGDISRSQHGRPTEGEAVQIGSSLHVTSLSGLHPWSSKDRKSKKSCHDPRYNDKELNICLGVIKKIMDMDEAASFSAPVDPVPLGFPSRVDIPMDFGTICSNLQNGFKYLNSDDVYKDVECIWAQCLKYNKKGDYIVYLMKRVKKKFLKYWTSAGLRTEMQKPTGQLEFLTSNGQMMGRISVSPSNYGHQDQVKPPSYSHHAQVPPSSYNHHVRPSSYSYQTQVPPSSYEHHSQVPPSIYNHHSQVHPSSYNHQSPAQVRPSGYIHQSLGEVRPSGYSHQAQGSPSSFNHDVQVPPSSFHQRTPVPPSSYDYQAQVPPSSSNYKVRVPPSSYSPEVQEPPSSYDHHSQLHPSSYSQLAQVPPSNYKAQVPPSSYSHHSQLPQLQPTTNESPKLLELQPRINAEYAGYLDVPSAYSVRKRKKDSARASIRAKSSRSKHQSKSTLHYQRRHTRSPSQQQPSPSLVQENDDTRSPDGLLGRSDLGQNGFVSTAVVNPIETSQSQLQPQKPPVGHSHEHRSQIPEGNIGQPQHSEWFASASHAGDMNGLERDVRQNEACSNNCPTETATPSFQHSPSLHQQYEDHSSPGRLEEGAPSSRKRKRDLPYRRAAWDTPDGRKMVVPLNDLGQAIGSEGRKLASFLGTLARDGNLAPVTLVHWSRVPKANKETMWLMVQAKFEIDPVIGKSWVMKSLSTKWRNWKARLKADYYSYKTDEERMRNLDKRVLPDQWPILISYWNKEDVQLYAARQKANRANLKGGHTSGSKSYATLREEERAKRADGKAPTRAELYVLTHTRKDGNPVSEKAAEVIAKLQEKASEKQQDSEASDSSRDTFRDVMGEEKNSHVRMCGLGPTPNTLYGRKCGHIQFAKMAMEAKKQADDEANKVYNKVEVIEQKYNSMEAQIARMNANMELMLGKMGVPPVMSISTHSDQVDQHTGARENPHQPEKPSSSESCS
ncbi:unnamed protein product [Linum trigynum]|uniref:Bromo domain-containing protein n=1 Tax=Linum trigynum TaxID=586398 RepID=A0AAV2D9B9_9ROSI